MSPVKVSPVMVVFLVVLIHKLKSNIAYDERTAAREISLLTKTNDDNRISFGKDGAIPLLTDLLTSLDPQTQEHAVTALLNLSIYDENKGIIVSCGAVLRIIYMLRKGSMEARVNAAATLFSLCEIYKNKVIIGGAGAIPPLVSLLSEGTQRGKKVAVTTLFNLCLYQGNKERVVKAGVIPILMKLLKEQQGVLKDEALTILSILSTHREGMLAIGEAEAVPVMVEFIGSGSPNNKENAASVLVELCSRDKRYLVEAQQHGVLEKLTDLLQHGTDRGKEKAGQLLEKLEDHHHDNYPADAVIIGGDKKPVSSNPLSRLLNKIGKGKGAKINSPESATRSSSDSMQPNDDELVKITLDVRENSVAVHSVKMASGADLEDPELRLLAKELGKNHAK